MSRYVNVRISCASCGAVRGESNHWFQVDVDYNVTSTGRNGWISYTVRHLNPQMMIGFVGYPVCGESCLHKIESQLLSEKKPA